MSRKPINIKNKEATKELKEDAPEEEPNFKIRLSDLGVVKRTPSVQELQIKKDRILYIFDKIIIKVKAAVCFQMLLENDSEILRNNLKCEEIQLVRYVLTKYTKSFNILKQCSGKKSDLEQDIFSKFEKINLSESMRNEVETFNNPAMLKAFEIVWLNPELNKFLVNKFQYLKNQSSKNFVNTLKSLKEVVRSKLSESGIEKIEREICLRHAWKYNLTIPVEISRVEKELQEQRDSFGEVLQNKTAQVNAYQKTINGNNLAFKNEVKVICMKSENEMMEDSRTSELRQEDLSEDSKNAVIQYDTLLNKNIRQEKTLRARKLKVESQLISWLTKFDSDIGDRQKEFDSVTKSFEEERDELFSLKTSFDEQEIEYNILMAEKQEEDFKVWAEIAIIFLKNRSVRLIQRAWRAYKERKLAKLLEKKAKAKAKAEQKAEAAAAKKK